MSLFSAIARRHAGLWRLTTKWKRLLVPHEREMVLLPYLVARDRIAVDVGANMGNYAAGLAEFASHVVAFEPNPQMASDLARLLGSKVTVIAAAVSDREGQIELRIPANGSGLATIEASNDLGGAKFDTISVPTVRLDDCGLENVGFLKVDVEGHELAVLRGAETTLRRCKPVLLIEAEERHRTDAIVSVKAFLYELGYSGWYLNDGALTSIEKLVAQHRVFNFIFLPAPPTP